MDKQLQKDYQNSKLFWDKVLSSDKAEKVDNTWITSRKIINIFSNYITNDSNVLDYGTGSGWAIFECFLRTKFKHGVALDTAKSAINNNQKIASLSGFKNIDFICGDQIILKSYKDKFDFAMSFNVLDVVPDEITIEILNKIYDCLKDNSYFLVGLNHSFSKKQMIEMLNSTQKDHYFYKEGILRLNKKSRKEWCKIFSTKFKIVSVFDFYLHNGEKKYPRVGFLLKK